MIQDLSNAYDRKVFGIDDGVASRRAHPLSTDAEEFQSFCRNSRGRLSSGPKLHISFLVPSPPQSLNQLRPIHFPGGLPG
jgi:hypothetical protein